MKVALISGITGMDGSYLGELLLKYNYDVWGIIRRCSNINTQRINHIFDKLILKYGDLSDCMCLLNIITEIKNKYGDNLEILEVYHLGAQSHVKVSFDLPEYTGNIDALGTLRMLEALRISGISLNKIRFYNAASSELFGKVQEVPQKETTPMYPRSPYGVAKLYSYWITKNYRESYGMYACSGILFNHESARRGHNFVTRKITIALGNILKGKQDKLVLGNIDALRDWGDSEDYVKGMHMILQHTEPDDFVLATGEMHSVREFVELAFGQKGFDIAWKGHGINEIGYDKNTGRELIFISEKYFRPAEVDELLGDATKAKTVLGWTPKTSFKELVKKMVDSDCA